MFLGIILMIMVSMSSLGAMLEPSTIDAVGEDNLSGGWVVVSPMISRENVFYYAAVITMVKTSSTLFKPKISAFCDGERIKFKGQSYRSADYKASCEVFKKEIWALYEELSHKLLLDAIGDIKDSDMRDAVTIGAKKAFEQWLNRMITKYYTKICMEYVRDTVTECNQILAGMRVRDAA